MEQQMITDVMPIFYYKSNQRNQYSSGYQKNVIQGQTPEWKTDTHNKDIK